ncbi:hypothetical protein ACEF48_24330 [Salmonella enterica subsp. enterica serovar Dublin]|uniref:hypothetical protein n=1 Tax=Salmonella enterica TaxID=28901 RepID=UPI00355C99B0
MHRVATRLPQPRKAVGCFHTLGYHLHCRFQKTAALNVRSRLHYSSGGVGSIRQRRAAAQGCRVTHTVETDEGTNPVDISLFGS